MEHLALEIFDLATAENPRPTESQYAFLPDDTSFTITDTSEIFASGDVWSHSFTLNVYANAHILGSAGDLHGGRLHELLHKRKARLWVEGVAMYLGFLKLDDEAEVDEDGNVDVTFESGQKTFEDMIEGAKANQVPMMGDVPIGMALWRKRWVKYTMDMRVSVSAKPSSSFESLNFMSELFDMDFECEGEEDDNSTQMYPRMVFPKGDFVNKETHVTEHVNCLNADKAYDEDENGLPLHPFCNVALCYQKQGYTKKNENGIEYEDYSSEPEAQRGYEYMPADRVNSAPNFYVIYWIRALMKHLGIHVEENQMMDVEDLRRLFFVNTDCSYKVPKYMRTTNSHPYGIYTFSTGAFWTRRLIPEQMDAKTLVKVSECDLESKDFAVTDSEWGTLTPSDGTLHVKAYEVRPLTEEQEIEYKEKNSLLHYAYAKSDCFPDADISEVIKAIESVAGVRFLFSDDFRRVRIILLRNIFQNQEVQEIHCDITGHSKQENSVRGFRLTYGNTEDTHFYYKGFADLLPHKKELWQEDNDEHDYSKWDLDAQYSDILNKVTAFNKTCYVTPDTGDAYGVKVDKDAKRYDEQHQSLFEFAGFMDAEDGDCTGEEETIETIEMGFTPAIMNDLNMEEERNKQLSDDQRKQKFALFLDETMRPRRPDLDDGQDYNDPEAVYSIERLYAEDSPAARMKGDDGVVKPGEFSIASDSYARIEDFSEDLYVKIHGFTNRYMHFSFSAEGHINEGFRLYLQDNYEPNDDGVSPIESHDWGLTLGIMRGSGSDAYVNYWPDPSDNEGNDTWEIVSGSSATAHPDTCDNYGREWDYDGMETITTPARAKSYMAEQWPDSNVDLVNRSSALARATLYFYALDNEGKPHALLLTHSGDDYVEKYLEGRSVSQMYAEDAARERRLIEVDSSHERGKTLYDLQQLAYAGGDPVAVAGGIGTRYGRFSLKLRAEKPNPYFDPTQPETHYDPEHPELNTNPRYLHIDNENLRRRGIADQFYKEYSLWKRNARIAVKTLHMDLAQLMAIDKTKKARVGDVTGFIRKIQYSVSKKSGLGEVKMEIMYI